MSYPLIPQGKSGTVLCPQHNLYSQDYIESRYDLYLSDEYPHRYRLHSKNPLRMDDYLAYDIMCPKCRNTLKAIGAPLNFHDLGLYECPVCKNYYGGNR